LAASAEYASEEAMDLMYNRLYVEGGGGGGGGSDDDDDDDIRCV
jgi:hypothetical protein